MKTNILLQGLINMLLIGIVIEGAISAVFSITAIRVIETKRVVQTTREAVTFLIALLFVYNVDALKLLRISGMNFPPIGDLIISAMVLTRLTGFIRDLFGRIRSGT